MALTLDLVKVTTPPCIKCGIASSINVPRAVVEALSNGLPIQEAWPYSTPDEREMIISGTHPACWEDMFGGSDCD